MKPAQFEYERPESLDEALERLFQLGEDAKVLSGGQSLVPMLNLRLARPSVLVDIGRIGLDTFEVTDSTVVVGALNRHRRFEYDAEVHRTVPLLAECARHIGYPAIRNRGTFGGSLAHADATAEWSLAVLALDATIVAQSSERGRREIPVEEFFVGRFTTALEWDEILTEVRFARPGPERRFTFTEFAERAGDFALGSVIIGADLGPDGVRRNPRVVTAGLGPTPVRLPEVEQLLEGATGVPGSDELRQAMEAAADGAGTRAGERDHVLGILQTLIEDSLVQMATSRNGE